MVSLLALLSMQVSPVLGQGYRQAVNRTLNPSGLEHVKVVYELLGWPVAAVVAVPLLFFFGYGYVVGLWKRDEYWHLLVATFFVTVLAYSLFPFLFMYL